MERPSRWFRKWLTVSASARRRLLCVEPLEDRATPASLQSPGVPAGTLASGEVSTQLLGTSGDGNAIIFASRASNLVTGATDNNDAFDLFWRDLSTGTTKLITAQAGTLNAVGFGTGSDVPLDQRAVISRDGQTVAYVSGATASSITGDNTLQDQLGTNDVFAWSAETASSRLVSIRVNENAAVGNKVGIEALNPAVSDTGKFVGYGTLLNASSIDFSVALDSGSSTYDLFRRDLSSTTPLMSTTAITRVPGKADVIGKYGTIAVPVGPYMSGDGRYFAFSTSVGNDILLGGIDLAATQDVFIRDMNDSTSTGLALASIATDGNPIGNTLGLFAVSPILTHSGNAVVFASNATGGSTAKELVAGFVDGAAPSDLYLRISPFQTGTATTKLISAVSGSTVTGANGFIRLPSTNENATYRVSPDAAFVAFTSGATNLVPGLSDANAGGLDVFVRSTQSNTTEAISVGKDGRTGSAPSDSPSISDDGNLITFISTSPELGAGANDTNSLPDVFLRDRAAKITRAVTTVPSGLSTGDGASSVAIIAPDGSNSLFVSTSKNLVTPSLSNATAQLYSQSLPLNRIFGNGETLLVASGASDGSAQNYDFNSNGKLSPAGASFVPFPGIVGIPRATTADVDGDGTTDTIYVAGPGGGSLVRVVSGATGSDLLSTTATFEAGFTGGLFVAATDFDNDGKSEIVVSPDVGGGGRVQVFAVSSGKLLQRANFFGIDDQTFRGGARVAVGDLNADGKQELIVGAGFGGGPRIAVFDGSKLFTTTPERLVGDFFAFPGNDSITLRNGVFVAAGDLDGDGNDDLVFGGGPGGGPRVYALNSKLLLAGNLTTTYNQPIVNFFASDANERGGVRVAVKDLDGDSLLDLVTSSGEDQPSAIRTFLGRSIPANSTTPAQLELFDPFNSSVLASGVFVG